MSLHQCVLIYIVPFKKSIAGVIYAYHFIFQPVPTKIVALVQFVHSCLLVEFCALRF